MKDEPGIEILVGRRALLTGVAGGGIALAAAPAMASGQQTATPGTPGPDPSSTGATEEAALEAPPPDPITAENVGSDFMVDVIKSVGIKYVAANPGSSFRALHESVINYGGNSAPELLTCLHEETSVAMAIGYYRACGKPMAAFVHSTVGLQHAAMSIYHAFADRAPVLIFCGNTLDAAGRRHQVEWVHSAQDNAAMVRDYLKWDDQPVSLGHFADSTVRGHRLATTAPMGPVMLTVDTDLQEKPLSDRPAIPRAATGRPPVVDQAGLAELAKLILAAEFPVILADRYARTDQGMPRLVEFAELVGAAVVDRTWRLNFPNNHPLNQGERSRQTIAQADLIVALEPVDLWGALNAMRDQLVRTQRSLAPEGQKVAVIGVGESLTRANYQDFQRYIGVDLNLAGDAEASLPLLTALVRKTMTATQRRAAAERTESLAKTHREARAGALRAARVGWDASPITTGRLSLDLYDVIKDEDWVLCGATNAISNWPQRLWPIDKPYRSIRVGGAAAIGASIGIATGIALAHRDQGRITVNIQTDGDLLYAPGALWTAAHHRIPMLSVMHNNRAYHQETMHIQRMGNRLERGIGRAGIGTEINDPAVDFSSLARGLGVWAEGPVTDPAELAPALRRALAVVKSGHPALVDVVTQVR